VERAVGVVDAQVAMRFQRQQNEFTSEDLNPLERFWRSWCDAANRDARLASDREVASIRAQGDAAQAAVDDS
jgi:hypothetical protein